MNMNIRSSETIAMLDPLMKDLTCLFSVSELMITLSDKKTIKATTAMEV